MRESGSLAAPAPVQLLRWLLWRRKAQELQLPGASVCVTSCTANCQRKRKPKELELPTGPPHWWWSQWSSWLTCQGPPPGFVPFPSMTGDFEELAIPKGELVSLYQPSVVFSSLFCPTSQPFSKSSSLFHQLLSALFFFPIPSNLLLPSLFHFPPPPPQSAELAPFPLSPLAHVRPLPFPRCLPKVPALRSTMHLFWASLKTGNKRLCTGWLGTSHPWFQLCGESCCRWYEGTLALPCPELVSPPVSTSSSRGPETSYFWWTGILGAYGWVIPCSQNDLTTLCLLCCQQP